MQNKITIKNRSECSLIEIEGIIGIPEEWQFDHPDQRVATYEGFREALQRIAQIENRRIIVEIRSTGGDVNDALLIYDALRATGAHITTRCYGYTASAATLIAQAADEGCREIAAGALYLIHNSICSTEGNAAELRAQTELLEKTDEQLANLYAERSGQPAEGFRSLMAENNGRGRWLSPEEAVEAGLADRLIEMRSPESAPDAEKEEEAHREGLAQNLLHGWRRLMAAVNSSNEASDPLPEERNIFHFGAPETTTQSRSRMLLTGQQSTLPTQVTPKEEPSLRDRLRSANAEAYEADLKHFRK